MRRLFLSLDSLDPRNDAYYVPIFVITCGLLGIVVVVFDLALRHVSGRSVTGSERGIAERPLMLLSWPFGAAVFGFVALVMHVLQPSILGGLVAAVSWKFAAEELMGRLNIGQRPREPQDDPPTAGEED